jgi:hypothetical protein
VTVVEPPEDPPLVVAYRLDHELEPALSASAAVVRNARSSASNTASTFVLSWWAAARSSTLTKWRPPSPSVTRQW